MDRDCELGDEMDDEMDNKCEDGWDEESEDTDSEDEPIVVKKHNKKIQKDGQKPKVNPIKTIDANLKYENDELVRKVDGIAADILSEKTSNSYRDHFFPMLINKMELKVGAEIGVDKAEFSNHILTKTGIQKYYCIDTWQNDFGSDCKPGYFDKSGDVRYEQAQEILDKFTGRVMTIRNTSIESSRYVGDNTLDFLYIDGDHSLEGILDDLRYWVPKVKIGGICGGHDYKDGPRSGITDYFGRQLPYKIKSVTDDFCARHGFALRTVGGRIISWYFVKNREYNGIF